MNRRIGEIWARSSVWIEHWPPEPGVPGSNPGGPASN